MKYKSFPARDKTRPASLPSILRRTETQEEKFVESYFTLKDMDLNDFNATTIKEISG